MKRTFIHEDFLLGNEPARDLYHSFAKSQPIIDYHNHLSIAQIASNHQFGDLSELWLSGDHYKWRAMRANGIPERFIAGDASPKEKFKAWASTVPFTLRNPLYQWTHLELAREFGIHRLLSSETADDIWHEANALLTGTRVHDLLDRHQIRVLCTTDDPTSPLDIHLGLERSDLRTKVFPTYRPDKAFQIYVPADYNLWLDQLEEVTSSSINTFDELVIALKKRHDDFHAAGCRASDHGLAFCPATPCTRAKAERIFQEVRRGTTCPPEDQIAYAAFLMLEFGRWNAAKGWAMQLHLGALRNNNSRLFNLVGRVFKFKNV